MLGARAGPAQRRIGCEHQRGEREPGHSRPDHRRIAGTDPEIGRPERLAAIADAGEGGVEHAADRPGDKLAELVGQAHRAAVKPDCAEGEQLANDQIRRACAKRAGEVQHRGARAEAEHRAHPVEPQRPRRGRAQALGDHPAGDPGRKRGPCQGKRREAGRRQRHRHHPLRRSRADVDEEMAAKLHRPRHQRHRHHRERHEQVVGGDDQQQRRQLGLTIKRCEREGAGGNEARDHQRKQHRDRGTARHLGLVEPGQAGNVPREAEVLEDRHQHRRRQPDRKQPDFSWPEEPARNHHRGDELHGEREVLPRHRPDRRPAHAHRGGLAFDSSRSGNGGHRPLRPRASASALRRAGRRAADRRSAPAGRPCATCHRAGRPRADSARQDRSRDR